jgi:fucose permease
MNNRLTRLDVASWGAFMALAASSVVMPICLPEISRSLDTSLSEGGGAETVRTLLIIAMLMLAGVLAHRWGKKPMMVSGQYLIAAGVLMASYSQNYPMLIVSLMVVGIGGGLTEAIVNPLVVDLHPQDSGKFLNITNAFYPVGVMVSALLFGELLTLGYSWRFIFRIAAAATLAMGLIFNTSRFPPAVHQEHSPWKLIGNVLGSGGFWLFAAAIFLGAGVESAFTFWSRSYVETFFEGVPRAGAIAVVIFAGAMAAGRLFAARGSQAMSLNALMMGSAVLGVAVTGMIPLATSLTGFYSLLALAGIATACFWPTILAAAADRLNADVTILMVMLAVVGVTGFGLTPWIMGVIGDREDLRAGFFVIPVFFIGLILVLAVEWRLSLTGAPREPVAPEPPRP